MSSDLNDCKFVVNLKGYRGVILFPALGTPALVKKGEPLTIIIAIDDQSFEIYKNVAKGTTLVGGAIPKDVALKLHSQLILANWKDRGSSSHDYSAYVAELIPEIHKKCTGLGSEENVLKGNKGNNGAADKPAENQPASHDVKSQNSDVKSQDKFEGYYLGKLPPKAGDFLVNIKPSDGIYPAPFGVLQQGATAMYNKGVDGKGFHHLFQINITSSLNLAHKGLKELLFLYLDYDAYNAAEVASASGGSQVRQNFITNPSDELLAAFYKEKIDKTKNISPHKDETCSLLRPKGFENQKLEMYKRMKVTPDAEKVYYNEYKNLFLSRHPVYVSDKDCLNVGVVSDLHLSARQTVFKKLSPKVIHNADDADSQNLGKINNEALVAAKALMEKILQGESDMLLAAGDLFDFSRNLSPHLLYKKNGGSKLRTGQMWKYFNYDKNKELYPWWPDFVMFLSLVQNCYNKYQKPIFFVNGNHEGWSEPYGLSPRILSVRANEGVAADHNYTIYEATLLYGPSYSNTGPPNNFKYKNIDWLHQVFTPWKDCLLNYGPKQNFLFLGWGNEEQIVDLVINGADSLPRAEEAFSAAQMSLTRAMVSRKKKNKGTLNILGAHFTFGAYALNMPLQGNETYQRTHTRIAPRDGSEHRRLRDSDIGTFNQNRDAVYGLLAKGDIDVTISGHTHRAALHYIDQSGQYIKTVFDHNPKAVKLRNNGRSIESINLKELGLDTCLCLVNGASGLYSKQNINRGKIYDFDSPQGLALTFEGGRPHKVSFPAHKAFKPRLAVRLDYLWLIDGLSPFVQENISVGNTPLSHSSGDGDWLLRPSSSRVNLSLAWLNFFREPGNPCQTITEADIPFDYFTLHAVFKRDGTHVKMEQNLKISPQGAGWGLSKGGGSVFTSQDFKNFVEGKVVRKGEGGDLSEWLFFASLHFKDVNGIGQQYDLKSPWCYPIDFDETTYRYIRRAKRRSEIADYGALKDIEEYNDKEL